jgi:hypothetical protein
VASTQATDWYKAQIYNLESGNDPCAVYPGIHGDCGYTGSLACGLGGADPCTKLTVDCSLSDYACEDNFFTQYMLDRYGSWEAAYAFHIANGYW